MADYNYDLGVIGGGAAGLTAAAGAARFGAKVLLVDRAEKLGGDCLHSGCVPSKTLIRTAKVRHLMATSKEYGLPGVDLPPVDFTQVKARIMEVIDKIQHHDSVDRFCSLGVRVEQGRPVFIDPHTIELDGEKISGRAWVVATGSEASAPPVEGLDAVEYLTNREIFYLDELPRSLLILGAGPIAIEMAQAFNRLGTNVQVIQRGPQILTKEDRDLADLVLKTLVEEGVTVHLNTGLVRVDQVGGRTEVTVSRDGQEKVLEAEHLLVALGRKPNTAGLGLEEIGVELARGALKVDDRLRTSVKHIYGAGDVTGRHQFTHAAGYEGGVALTNAILRLPRKADYTWLPRATYTEPELAGIGLNEKAAEKAGRKYSVITEEFGDNDRAVAENSGRGLIKLILDEKEKPLGVQILGPRAGDLLGEWAAVLNGKVKLSALASAVHPYPTLAEINKRVAGTYLSPKIFSDKVKKGLKLVFNLKGRACKLEDED